jgi:hypothetical protein
VDLAARVATGFGLAGGMSGKSCLAGSLFPLFLPFAQETSSLLWFFAGSKLLRLAGLATSGFSLKNAGKCQKQEDTALGPMNQCNDCRNVAFRSRKERNFRGAKGDTCFLANS